MEIISHRGYWKYAEEKNKDTAFDRTFSMGLGTETDIRDYLGELVISHDIATAESTKAEHFFKNYTQYSKRPALALNIKADGLQDRVKALIEIYKITNYFVFDMSIPDTIGYKNAGINFFSRQSEYELQPVFYSECSGIWLDSFTTTWYDNNLIRDHISNNKMVAIVSAELHKRDHIALWQQLKSDNLHRERNVILCTDFPEQAINFFKD